MHRLQESIIPDLWASIIVLIIVGIVAMVVMVVVAVVLIIDNIKHGKD